MTKKELRTKILEKRSILSRQEVDERSRQIWSHLQELAEFQSAVTVHTYIAWQNEVNTLILIKWLLMNRRRVVVPRVEKASNSLRHFEINSLSGLRPGTFGILEPAAESAVEICPQEIELVIVPGLAFDLSGNRLGYGGGYYDGFLKELSAQKVAPAYDFQVVDSVPVDENDVPVNIIVAENGVFRK